MIGQVKSWLGAALQDQGKLAEAEPLLLAAFNEMTERLDTTPNYGKLYRRDPAFRLVVLYTAQNKADEAAAWQKRFDALPGAAKPAEKK